MTTTERILVATKALLADETRWCQLAPARKRSGEMCSSSSADAHSFCLLGALTKIAGEDHAGRTEAMRVLGVAVLEITGVDEIRLSILGFNDTIDHASVIQALGRAAELAGRESTA